MRGASRTQWSIVAIIALVPLAYWPPLRDYTLTPKLLVAQVALVVLFASLWYHRAPIRTSSLSLPIFAYAALSALSTLWATDTTASLLELIKLFTGVALFLALSATDDTYRRRAVIASVASVSVSALLGITQHLDIAPFVIPSAGLPSGTLGFRNVAATVTIQIIPFAIWLFFRKGANRVAWGTGLIVLITFLLHTRTRGAWIGLTVAAITWLVLNTERNLKARLRTLVPIVLIGSVLGLIPSQGAKLGPQDIDEKKTSVGDTLTSILEEGGDRGRLTMWRQTMSMIIANPMGVGLGNWAIQYPAYDQGQLVTDFGAPSRPHNDLLWIASEVGWGGLAVFIWILVVAARIAWHAEAEMSGLAAAALASLIAVVVHACFSFPRDRATPTLLFWFVLGLLSTMDSATRERSSTHWATAAALVAMTFALTTRVAAFEQHLNRAVSLERSADWEGVAAETELALGIGRFHTEAIHLRGYALNTLGQYTDAATHYERYEGFRPYDVQVRNGYAIALQHTGRLEASAAQYRRARDLVAASTDLDYNLATLLIQAKKPDEAVELLKAIVDRGQGDAGVLFYLGNALALSGQDSQAIQALERATELDQNLSQAWFVLGEIRYRSGDGHGAQEAFMLFLELHPADDAYARRARLAIQSLETPRGDGKDR